MMSIAHHLAASLAVVLLAAVSANAQEHRMAPSTVSPQAAEALNKFYAQAAQSPFLRVKPASVADWDAVNARLKPMLAMRDNAVLKRLGTSVTDDTISGVPVVRLCPAGYRPGKRTIVYLHGGGYVYFSARASLTLPALLADATGDEVVSVDYSVAPHGNWKSITDQVLSVWKGLLKDGKSARAVGLMGDSADGGLAAGSVLKMRDAGLPLPAALYLRSPWSDITATGDTMQTLASADPTLDQDGLSWGADAYADPADQKDPYVSPVYGDYRAAFPPILIQVSTREIFLSHSVRHYQAIRSGNHEAVLDVYEGMPHVWPVFMPQVPESQTAIKAAAPFFDAHLSSK